VILSGGILSLVCYPFKEIAIFAMIMSVLAMAESILAINAYLGLVLQIGLFVLCIFVAPMHPGGVCLASSIALYSIKHLT
jgi:hypothetical protein